MAPESAPLSPTLPNLFRQEPFHAPPRIPRREGSRTPSSRQGRQPSVVATTGNIALARCSPRSISAHAGSADRRLVHDGLRVAIAAVFGGVAGRRRFATAEN